MFGHKINDALLSSGKQAMRTIWESIVISGVITGM